MDILDEKDLDGVSYEELLQIHVGMHHPLEDSDDSEEDIHYSKVPVFDLQQIKAIAVNAKDLHCDDQSSFKSVKKCLGPQDAEILEIARSLSELISPSYCSVCLKHADKREKHYHSKNHFTSIISWIESRTRTTDQNVTKKIFCTPCNLPLVQRSKRHYSTKAHIHNERRFCTLCFQVITKPMKHHIYQHCVNDAENEDLRSTSENPLSCNRETVARELKAKLTSSICHLCNRTVTKSSKHYRKKRHLKTVRAWIDDNSYRIGIYKAKDQSSFYCEACNEVFANVDLSKQHYGTMEHLKSLSTFCDTCRRHLSTRETLRNHYGKKHNNDILEPIKATGQKLKELTKLNVCQLCTLRFNKTTAAQTHYQTSSAHAIRVFDFLEMNKAEFCGNPFGGHRSDSENSTCSEPSYPLTEPSEDNDDGEPEHSHNEHDVGSTDVFDDNDNRESEYSRTESDVHSTEETNDNEFELLDSILKEQIVHEISLLMDKTYYCKSVPLKVVLECLKSLNRQIAGIIENNKMLPNTEESSKILSKNSFKVDHRLPEVLSKYKFFSPSITKSPFDSANQDNAKLKLAREITRMKAILEMFSVEVALRFAHGFRTLMINVGKDNFDVEFAFSFPEVPGVASNLLKIELEVLEHRLTKSKKISLELALEIVTQFNVRLEMEAERMKRESKTFIDKNQECFKNTEKDAACELNPLKSLSDDCVNATDSHAEKPIGIDQDYVKLQLRTEITRMKTVLSENCVLLTALKYVRSLKMLIKKIQEKQENTFDKVDVGVVFLSTEVVIEDAAGDLVLQRELAGLEWLLTVGRKSFEAELALDIVKQFNVELERLIKAQKGDNDGGNSKHDDFCSNNKIV